MKSGGLHEEGGRSIHFPGSETVQRLGAVVTEPHLAKVRREKPKRNSRPKKKHKEWEFSLLKEKGLVAKSVP